MIQHIIPLLSNCSKFLHQPESFRKTLDCHLSFQLNKLKSSESILRIFSMSPYASLFINLSYIKFSRNPLIV
jgi:hypothetical protein